MDKKFISLLALATTLLLSGCFGGMWTGANLIYNRHNVYKKIDDYTLAYRANHLLFFDDRLKQTDTYLDLATFNGDLLLAGHVPESELIALINQRLAPLTGYRRLFKQVALRQTNNHGIKDTWITTSIRSRMIADAEIDPAMFKIITVDGIVYVMGDVRPEQAHRVLRIAKQTRGVVRVVTLLKYLKICGLRKNRPQ